MLEHSCHTYCGVDAGRAAITSRRTVPAAAGTPSGAARSPASRIARNADHQRVQRDRLRLPGPHRRARGAVVALRPVDGRGPAARPGRRERRSPQPRSPCHGPARCRAGRRRPRHGTAARPGAGGAGRRRIALRARHTGRDSAGPRGLASAPACPIPQSSWQVPEYWRRAVDADVLPVAYGAILGFGVFTAVVVGAFWVFVAVTLIYPAPVAAAGLAGLRRRPDRRVLPGAAAAAAGADPSHRG